MDPSLPAGGFEPALELKGEVLHISELDFNPDMCKKESGFIKNEVSDIQSVEDLDRLEHNESLMIPSDGNCVGISSCCAISDSNKSEGSQLPSESDLGQDGEMREPLSTIEHSTPFMVDIYRDKNGFVPSFDTLHSPMENKKLNSVIEIEDSALYSSEHSFRVNGYHHHEVMEKEDAIQKGHRLPAIDERENIQLGHTSESRKFEEQEPYNKNPDEQDVDHHGEMKSRFCVSQIQHYDLEENGPSDSPQISQKITASSEAWEVSTTLGKPSDIQVAEQNEENTIKSPCPSRSPSYRLTPSPKRLDKVHKRASSCDRMSPPKRIKSSSPTMTSTRDSDQMADSTYERRKPLSPRGASLEDSGKKTHSPTRHLFISPLGQDSSLKNYSAENHGLLGNQGSPQRRGSPRNCNQLHAEDYSRSEDLPQRKDLPTTQESPLRHDSTRRLDKPQSGHSPGRNDLSPRGDIISRQDSPPKSGSSRRRDSTRRRDSPRKRASPRGDSPRKHIAASPRKHNSSRKKDRSVSQSPPRRRDLSSYKRHDTSRSRSPSRRDPHRRSPRRRHSSRHRSPSPRYRCRHHSPRRRPWSPRSNRSTGIGRPGKNLFVAGFSFATTERDLEKKFSKFGRVTDARVVRDKRSGDSRGFGFLSLERDEDADAAIRALDQTEWNGRIVLVEKAKTSVH